MRYPNQQCIRRILNLMEGDLTKWIELFYSDIPDMTKHWNYNETKRETYAKLLAGSTNGNHLTVYRKLSDEMWGFISVNKSAAEWDRKLDYIFFGLIDMILCLLVYEDSSDMFDDDVDEIRLLAELGDHKALLMLAVCMALKDKVAKTCYTIKLPTEQNEYDCICHTPHCYP